MRKQIIAMIMAIAMIVAMFEGHTIAYAGGSTMTEAEERAYWSQFTSHVFDAELTAEQKKLWESWEDACMDALVTQEDLVMHTCSTANCRNSDYAELPGITGYDTTKGMMNFTRIFYNSHPQFYFLVRWTTDGAAGLVYKKYSNGKQRRQITLQMKAQLDTWIDEVKAGAASKSDYDLEVEAHDLICEELSYADYDYLTKDSGIAAGYEDEGTATPFIKKDGTSLYYAYALNMILKGLGIEAVVGGSVHYMDSVSVVCINKNYYYVDAYTDDKRTMISRAALNVSLNELSSKGGREVDSYTMIDPGHSTYDLVVKNSDIWIGQNRCLKPKISIAEDKSITLSPVNSSEKVYYTLNGKKPTSSSTLYKEVIQCKDSAVLKAVSTSTGFANSRVAQMNVEGSMLGYLKYESPYANTTGNMAIVSCRTDKTITLANNEYIRQGYSFVGWNTRPDGTGTSYKSGQKVSGIVNPTETTKLYAMWTPIKYNIAFNKNGGKGTTMKTMKDCLYDQQYTLAKTNLKKTNYTFTGWNTKKDGSGQAFDDASSVLNLTTNAETVTLYAQWETDTYKIVYHLDGGDNSDKNPSEYSPITKVTLKNPTKAGYTFKGWYSDSGLKKKKSTIAKGSTGKKEFYAKWLGNTYTVRFYPNSATKGTTANLKCQYGKEFKLSKNGYTKKGKSFVGWNTEKNGSGTSYKDGQTIKNLTSKKNGTIKLYAQWK